jgi:hypothetical protein
LKFGNRQPIPSCQPSLNLLLFLLIIPVFNSDPT